MIPDKDQGVSELIGTILVIILVIAIAGIIAALVFGWSIPLQRTPYFVSEATPIENASVVKLFHAQGDPVSLYPGATQGLPMKMTLASGAVTYDVTPLPTAAGKGWRAGETLYIFRNSSGVWIADSPALILNSTGFAPGPWRLSLIDITSNVLIVQHTLDLAGDGDGPVPLPPVAEFMANVTAGTAPLVVQFIDQSAGNPTMWSWNFGDGNASSSQNPIHQYTVVGTYPVSLTATNADGADTETKTNYITVLPPASNPITDFNGVRGSPPNHFTASFNWTQAINATTIRIQQTLTGQGNWIDSTHSPIAPTGTTATVSGLSGVGVKYDFRLVVTGGQNAGISNVVVNI